MAWFGQFRSEWPVERWGKWNELDYTGKYYPAFACGSGSLLSADLIAWLASNRDSLHPFQGEDVSLGIWLAAVNPQLVKVCTRHGNFYVVAPPSVRSFDPSLWC